MSTEEKKSAPETKTADQSKELAALTKKLEKSEAAREKLEAEAADLRVQVNTLNEALAAQPVDATGADFVQLGGIRYAILHRNGVKEFFEDIKRRNVPEDVTAIAIDLKA